MDTDAPRIRMKMLKDATIIMIIQEVQNKIFESNVLGYKNS